MSRTLFFVVLCSVLSILNASLASVARHDVQTIKHETGVTVNINLNGKTVTLELEPNTHVAPSDLGHTVQPYKGKGEMSTFIRLTFDKDFESFTGFFYHEGKFHAVKPSEDGFELSNIEDMGSDTKCGTTDANGKEEQHSIFNSEVMKRNAKRQYDLSDVRPAYGSLELPTPNCQSAPRVMDIAVVCDNLFVQSKAQQGVNVRDYIVTEYNTASAVYERTVALSLNVKNIDVVSYPGGHSWNRNRCPGHLRELLRDFRNHARRTYATDQYDAWHLHTACDDAYQPTAWAYTDSVCTRNQGAIVFNLPDTNGFQYVAHNLGYSLGARDDLQNGGIMSSGPDEHWFSQHSQNQLCDYLRTADCLPTVGQANDPPPPSPPAAYATVPEPVVCTPQCGAYTCGDDGCGGSCGVCAYNEDCVNQVCTARCVPDCASSSCGSDGCGGVCGICSEGEECHNSQCRAIVPPCEPDCASKNCGDDGCGGTCGDCGEYGQCGQYGRCEARCVPQCAEKNCGDDGCGGVCGYCAVGSKCEYGVCGGVEEVCAPKCDGRTCGSDGCGGSCGSCADGNICIGGQCQCVPSCRGKVCGPDGCGGSCGDCPGAYDSCDGRGQCSCTPDCATKECGDDGCGGTCGMCQYNEQCSQYGICQCQSACEGKTCGDDGCGGTCGTCAPGQQCQTGVCICIPNCEGKTCGDDGCGGSCGNCGAYDQCGSNGQCSCVPQCSEKDCGDDGCGGSCGDCASGSVCSYGKCQAQNLCEPSCELVSSSGNTYTTQCGEDGCGGSCGTCGAGQFCSRRGICECTRQCTGKQCGDDGCGSNCGNCAYGMECSAEGQCVPSCVPNCVYKECGSDGCGGECGQCDSNADCNAFRCVERYVAPPPEPEPETPAYQTMEVNQDLNLHQGEWAYSEMRIVPNVVTNVRMRVPRGRVDVYASLEERPTERRYNFRSSTPDEGSNDAYLQIPTIDYKKRQAYQTVFVGVLAREESTCKAQVERRLSYSNEIVDDGNQLIEKETENISSAVRNTVSLVFAFLLSRFFF